MRPSALRDCVTGAACAPMVVAGGVEVAVVGKGCVDARLDAATTAVLGVRVVVPPVDAMAVTEGLFVGVGLGDRVAVLVAAEAEWLGVVTLDAGDVGTLEREGVGDGFGVGLVVGCELVDGDDVGLGGVATGVAHPTSG
jgi:hypothetical protein